MRELPVALRYYLWLIYVISAALIVTRIAPLLPGGPVGHVPGSVFLQAVAFTALAYIGERTMLQVSGSVSQSLSTTIHIVTILLLPPPFPMLVTLAAVLPSHARARKPLFKRAFNICHPTLVVGLSNMLCTAVAGPFTAIRHGDIVSTVLQPNNTNIAALVLLISLYYILDAGTMLGVLSLVDGRAPWLVWRQMQAPTLLPELAAATMGILAAMAWLYSPLLVSLFVLPVTSLRVAFRVIKEAEDRAQALRLRGEQLEVVLAAGQRLRLQHTQADLLLPVAEAARAVVGAESVAAYLRDEEEPTTLQRVVLVPEEGAESSPSRLPVPPSGSGMLEVKEDRTLLVPLESDGASITGLLRLEGIPEGLGHDDRDALAILANQAAIALQNARMHERALAQASQDGLTGLLNHRTFQIRLEDEITRARRGGHPLALMMVDLDDFGVINNTHGHQTGDATLIAIAAALRDNVRGPDIAARYGGDEFAVILPETDMDEALTVAERVGAAIAGLRLVDRDVPIRVGASVGVAALPLHARTREDLIRAADQASYGAKHAGKGRVGRPEDATLALGRDPQALAAQLEHANIATVEALAAAVDAKDPYTRGHSQRVSAYAVAIAHALGLSTGDVARVRLAGLLHDVGKIGVPDAILTKPFKLSEEEITIIRTHPAIGEHMLSAVPFLRDILPAVRHHHERWDGRGYPDGLAGASIPHDAAILMVADSFDAMTSSRTYRPALPLEEACRRVREDSGTQFDPRIVDAFEQALADGALTLLAPEKPHSYAAALAS